MRQYLYKNILYKLFRRDSALTLFHLSFLILYLITNIGDAMLRVSSGISLHYYIHNPALHHDQLFRRFAIKIFLHIGIGQYGAFNSRYIKA
jgi:hypothetical protein